MELNRIKDISTFVAVVKFGSYTEAVKILNLSRSAIGKSVMRLESQLGVRLFNRSTRQLNLTDEGAEIYERCEQILENLETLDTLIKSRREKPTGNLKLTASLPLGQRYILPVVNNFLQEWPELNAEIVFTDRFIDLIKERFDIAIRIGDSQKDSRLVTRTIAQQHMITCASPSYLQKHGTPNSPSQLKEHQTIFFRTTDKRKSWCFQIDQEIYIHDGPSKIDIDSSEAIMSSAIAGFGIIHLPDYLVYEALKSGKLVSVLNSFTIESEAISIVYPSKKYLLPRVRKFIDILTEDWDQNGAPWTRD